MAATSRLPQHGLFTGLEDSQTQKTEKQSDTFWRLLLSASAVNMHLPFLAEPLGESSVATSAAPKSAEMTKAILESSPIPVSYIE